MRSTVAGVLLASLSAGATGPVYRHADGGVAILDVERAAILLPGSGPEADRVVHVDGGAWVAPFQRTAEGQEHADLVARNKHLEEHAADMPKVWVAGAFGTGVLFGVVATLIATGAVKLPR